MPLPVQYEVREQVAIYRQRGWYSVPLRPRSKSPVSNDWPIVRIELDEIKAAFSTKDNVGLILGEPSGSSMLIWTVSKQSRPPISIFRQHRQSPAVHRHRVHIVGTSPQVRSQRNTAIRLPAR